MKLFFGTWMDATTRGRNFVLATSPDVISTMGSSVAATIVASEGGQLSPDRFASALTVPIGLEEVAHASHDPISEIGRASCRERV